MLQGHANEDCRVLHPELVADINEDAKKEEKEHEKGDVVTYPGINDKGKNKTKIPDEAGNKSVLAPERAVSTYNNFDVLEKIIEGEVNNSVKDQGADDKVKEVEKVNDREDTIKNTERKMDSNGEQAGQTTKDVYESVGEMVDEGVIAVEEDDPNKNLEDRSASVGYIIDEGVIAVEENDPDNNLEDIRASVGKMIDEGVIAVEENDPGKKLEDRGARRRLGIRYAHYNCNGKIWLFVNDNVDVEILQDLEQQITIKLLFQDWNKSLMVTMVYAKCDHLERISLWDSLYSLADQMELPWLVGGDFNVIMNEDEKIGGLPVSPDEYGDFAFCSDYIFKRLDRIIANSKLQDWFAHMEVQHLSRTGSYHALLLLTCGESSQHIRKPFRFLKFWIEHESFLEVVNQAWITYFKGDDFIRFKLKLKNVKSALSAWSKETFSDIFKQLEVREEVVRIKEQCFEEDPTPMNRMVLQQAQRALKKYVHYEEEFWRQKSHMTSFTEGDRNTRYFRSIVNGRRKRLQIKRIQNQQGVWIEGESLLAEKAYRFYQQQFSQEVDH
ncbi:uncharacterized protein LOC132639371 [Lycium barbarum]|uniref:uncharacterized protein LOC132639371 n=1 Tax=Lycium barbarum TaxID=112863 RepID=UPI00293E631C|nr:uncharacterized protein LOC132639371 [Lycium barbarum]